MPLTKKKGPAATSRTSAEPGGSSYGYLRIYRVVAHIPKGSVATYGQIAELAGLPGRARMVGTALSVSADPSLPWHRVVNARGEISRRDGGSPSETVQRLRLESEGVVFDRHGRIPLRRFQWSPPRG